MPYKFPEISIYSSNSSSLNSDEVNVGISINADAGQTIWHSHIHIIPRYKGDVENPRGGIRGVIPNKKEY